MEKPSNKWIPIREKSLIKSPVMEVIERRAKSSEDDREHTFYLLKSSDWCNIIPVTEDGKVIMVRQDRIGINDHTVEVPGGVADAEDQSLQAAAIREMTEETGYVPLPGARCIPLGWSFPNPAIMNNRVHSFVIGPVRREKAQELDTAEMIEVVEVPISEIPKRILNGEINHALMLNTFFYLALQVPEVQDALEKQLRTFSAGQSK